MNERNELGIKFSPAFLALIFVAGLVVGGMVSFYITFQQLSIFRRDLSILKNQVSALSGNQTIINQNITIYQNVTALSELYESVKDSVVLILGKTASDDSIQGSGFVYNYSGTMVVITNYHVVEQTTSISVTFSNGNGYAAVINGTDPYADLALLIVDAPQEEFKPLVIVSSSTLGVGHPVIAIGNPYGLVGSMTTGVVSALGRTITEAATGGFAIANVIQTSAPINPGNSGGPLLNYNGSVVGVTTAIVADSQGLGFAIPSNTITKEIDQLFRFGTYEGHSYLGIVGTDMDYDTAQSMGLSVTYGWRVVEVREGPSEGILAVNDVIIALNGTRVRNLDDLASYLEEKTLPGNAVIVTVVNGTGASNATVVLGSRPLP